jgi:hypothetical protein
VKATVADRLGALLLAVVIAATAALCAYSAIANALGPKYRAGDCVSDKARFDASLEPWERAWVADPRVYRVLSVSESKYLTEPVNGSGNFGWDNSIASVDSVAVGVKCPKGEK